MSDDRDVPRAADVRTRQQPRRRRPLPSPENVEKRERHEPVTIEELVPDETRSQSSRLQAMREDPAGTCADVVLCAGSMRILAHRSILCTYDYFRVALGPNAGFREADSREFRFEGLSEAALEAIVSFFYDVRLSSALPFPVLHEVWSFATLHFFEDLRKSASEHLIERLSRDLAVEVLRQAALFGDGEVIRACASLIFLRPDGKDTGEHSILSLSLEEMKALSTGAVRGKEADWARMVLDWVHADKSQRSVYCSSLMEGIQLDELSGSTLVSLGEKMLDLQRRDRGDSPSIDDSIQRSLIRKMRMLEAELGSVSQSPEASRAADLMYRDEREIRNRCVIM